ncbi:MAG: YebC/PmpR family DNA-binding transcriptional regulator [Candidatus Azambacteria bacterium]|nr:YebC/PmpR family DNA-binding transcriptional regulator [Candidatus Azambacteria bacterium]
MSGHSKWSTIKHKKALTDAKRSKVFSKVTSLITIAARKGGDPDKNPSLRAVIEKAHEVNVPKENIERAIKRGTGEIAGAALDEVIYGAFGPGGAVILITAITDNKNRTLAEIKKILQEHNIKFAELNSIQWMFRREGADWIPNNPIKIEGENTKKELEALYDDLDEQQDVNEIYDNTGD